MKRQPARKSARPVRFQRLLVPVDFAPASLAAVRHAVYLAERFQARVDLIYVEPVAIPADVTQLPIVMEQQKHKERAKVWLTKLAAGSIPAELRGRAEVVSGAPYHEINQFAEKRRTDLIVLPTHGYTGLKHVLLGSTTERVIRHAPCPVLTLRQRSRAGAKLHHIRRVLVPTDFSTAAQSGLASAVACAQQFSAKLVVCHVIEPPSYPQFGYAHVAIVERKRRAAAEEQMAQVKKGLKLPAQFRIRGGTAHQEIVAEAVRSKADLIVLATHGHTALAHMLLGSTAERVVRHAHCPVLVVRARK